MANAALSLSVDNFTDEVLGASEPVLVDFTASWCGPCQRLAPIIDSLAAKYAGKVKIGKVDVDDNQDLAIKFGIQSVPVVLIFKSGEVVDTVKGYQPENVFVGKLDAVIA